MTSVNEIYPAKLVQLTVDLPVTILVLARILDQITMIVPLRVFEEDVNLPIVEGKDPLLVWQTYRTVECLLGFPLIQLHRRYMHTTILAGHWLMFVAGLVAPTYLIDVGLLYNVSSLPILEKGEQFLRVIGIFALLVATIKLAYSENLPCFCFIYMLE